MAPELSEPMPDALCNRLVLNMIRQDDTLQARARADASRKEPNQ